MNETHGSDPVDSPPDADEAADAALDAVEPDRLLPGEDEGTDHPDDAVHWTKVYSELLDFKRSLLTVTESRLVTMGGAARTEVEETDLMILVAEAARLERRLHYWERRCAQLGARPC